MKIPEKNELNVTKYNVVAKPRPDGKADLEVVVEYSGEDAVEMREELIPASDSERHDMIVDWLEKCRPASR